MCIIPIDYGWNIRISDNTRKHFMVSQISNFWPSQQWSFIVSPKPLIGKKKFWIIQICELYNILYIFIFYIEDILIKHTLFGAQSRGDFTGKRVKNGKITQSYYTQLPLHGRIEIFLKAHGRHVDRVRDSLSRRELI